jgi:hypothetical protein
MTHELYVHTQGVGYRIPAAYIDQPFKRNVPGFVFMTQAEAEAEAIAHIAELEAAAVEPAEPLTE